MNPSYRYQIDITIQATRPIDDVVLRRVGYLPFVPRNGDTLRFTCSETDETMDLELNEGYYDVAEGMFIFNMTDDQVRESHRDGEIVTAADVAKSYIDFGFCKLKIHP